jgi:hypothetical protein
MEDDAGILTSDTRRELLEQKREAGDLTLDEFEILLDREQIAISAEAALHEEEGKEHGDAETEVKRAKFHGFVADAKQSWSKRAQSLKNKQKELASKTKKRSSLLKKKGEGLVSGASNRWKMLKQAKLSPIGGSNRKATQDAQQVFFFSATALLCNIRFFFTTFCSQ